MYLSRLLLNPLSHKVRRDLADCQSLHRTILSVFPKVTEEGRKARESFDVLHRVDTKKNSKIIALIVQSSVEPDWGSLPKNYLLDTFGNPENPASKDITEQFQSLRDGLILSFKLRANPTRKIGTSLKEDRISGKAKKHGTRVPIAKEQDQIAWLERKGDNGGFKLLKTRLSAQNPDVVVIPEGNVKGTKRDGDKTLKWKLSFRGVVFQGNLKINDREVFLKTLRKGLGSGKAYGFGLLSIARPMGKDIAGST